MVDRGSPRSTGRPSRAGKVGGKAMRAMVLGSPGPIGSRPLHLEEVPVPEPGDGQLLVRVAMCGVCRTDLHVVTGELPPLRPRVIPGHEVVGQVARVGAGVEGFRAGDPVGVPWLHATCGRCAFCRTGRENLCDLKRFTGYSDDGGYAEYLVAEAPYALPLPSGEPSRWAPFLCAGIIGYRALKMALPNAPGGRIGFFGFGGSAHLTLPMAERLGYETVAFDRAPEHLALAERLGATATVRLGAAGDPEGGPFLDAAVVFAPAGEVVLEALRRLRKGGTVAIAAIHMSPIPSIDYDRLLFGERRLVSVEANTRADAREYLRLVERYRLESTVSVRGLAEANEALLDLDEGRVVGAVVLDCR
jgi:alcohol dehydrogenase, propanol-preferring